MGHVERQKDAVLGTIKILILIEFIFDREILPPKNVLHHGMLGIFVSDPPSAAGSPGMAGEVAANHINILRPPTVGCGMNGENSATLLDIVDEGLAHFGILHPIFKVRVIVQTDRIILLNLIGSEFGEIIGKGDIK